MSSLLIKNGTIINEERRFPGSIYIVDQKIKEITEGYSNRVADQVIDAKDKLILPGIIDDQVHFRTPGLTHKGDIFTESRAAVAGGITSYLEMPNVNPPTTTRQLLEEKIKIAENNSWANFGFYFGTTNDNLEEIKKIDPRLVCGVKVFMGSSTGNMLVDNNDVLEEIFASSPVIIATHCEDENTIGANLNKAIEKYGDNIPIHEHPIIRDAEACFKSTLKAIELAKKHNTQLHILHLSTQKEIEYIAQLSSEERKNITTEVCVHHLWFTDKDYAEKGTLIKWNPAIKTLADREALRNAVRNNVIDIIATDHAPHTIEEKQRNYVSCPSGAPMVQHSLMVMCEMVAQGIFSYETIVEKMCHAPARIFNIQNRGFIREDFYADLVIVNPNLSMTVNKNNILYKCGWSPLENDTFSHSVETTIINGEIVYHRGKFDKSSAMKLEFYRSI